MNAIDAAASSAPATARVPMIGLLRALLIAEAIGGLVVAIFLSLIAAEVRDAAAASGAPSSEDAIRFGAAGALIVGILALVASRGARRRRPSAWTLAAVIQVMVAIGIGIAVLVAEWHPLYLVGFALAAAVMVVLSTASVRHALGQA